LGPVEPLIHGVTHWLALGWLTGKLHLKLTPCPRLVPNCFADPSAQNRVALAAAELACPSGPKVGAVYVFISPHNLAVGAASSVCPALIVHNSPLSRSRWA